MDQPGGGGWESHAMGLSEAFTDVEDEDGVIEAAMILHS